MLRLDHVRLAEPGLREDFRQPAQALARKYDLSQNLNATLKVFEKLAR